MVRLLRPAPILQATSAALLKNEGGVRGMAGAVGLCGIAFFSSVELIWIVLARTPQVLPIKRNAVVAVVGDACDSPYDLDAVSKQWNKARATRVLLREY